MVEQNKNYILRANLPGLPGGFPAGLPHQTPVADKLATGTLYIEEGRITTMKMGQKTSTDHRFKQPNRELKVLDLTPYTLIPPLVDCHVHLALDGLDFTAARRRWDQPEQLQQQIKRQLQDTLAQGILAVRDGGDRRGITWQIRHQVQAGHIPGPRMITTIQALRKPQSYGSFLGPGTPMAELESTLDRLVQQQADQIKVIVSGVVSFKAYGQVGPVSYTAAELRALVRAAQSRGLRVMAHASSDAAVKMAVEAGVNTIEHGYFVRNETLEQMAARGIAWIPTLVPVAAQLNNRGPTGPDRASRYVIEKTVHRQLAMVGKAAALGVTLGVGTDAGAAGVRHGHGFRQELELYRLANLTPAQIYHSATVAGARLLGLPWGCIAPGYPAALIAVEGNPLLDSSSLARVKYAFLPPE